MTILDEWKSVVQSALKLNNSNSGSYTVTEEIREGEEGGGREGERQEGSLDLLLVHYKPAKGTSKIVVPVGLMRKAISNEYAIDTVAQSITTTYRPQTWGGKKVYFAVCDPFRKEIAFYNIDEHDMQEFDRTCQLGTEGSRFVWVAEHNRPLFGA
ncbi:hypothetical protein K505DRAFT_362046 [Melanomma pulvis-pyrius CBS 109.77]|uniref:Uncharacterized protein n=1 Tax=Melanomma pulvis-pyrius CBS 109.77 TaxID=1314802 RepID=A0A6A6XBU4_9PLEO|nr:hypothetical protein K505DRAFT_362046 [Melanomma pulvis-pyrius CBS 109.77]